MEDKIARFIKAYSQVPDELKNQIIVTINGKPYTWNSSFFEIKTKGRLYRQILNTLSAIGII